MTDLLTVAKIWLRINHGRLDADIEQTISAARAELLRVGVSEDAVNGDYPLVTDTIKTYVIRAYTSDPVKYDAYGLAWQTQVDGLRKSTTYGNYSVDQARRRKQRKK